jgi:hypothetical protein
MDEDEDTRKKVAEQLCVAKERKKREDKSRVKRQRQQALTATRDRASHTNKDQKKRKEGGTRNEPGIQRSAGSGRDRKAFRDCMLKQTGSTLQQYEKQKTKNKAR